MSVLAFFLAEPEAKRYGLEIGREAHVGSGTLYPILDRLESDGIVQGEWEELDEKAAGRRRRRYYQLTPNGRVWAEQQVRRAMPGVFGQNLGWAR